MTAATDLRAEEVVKLTLEGNSAPTIASRLGITPRSVARIRVRAQIAQPHPPPLTREQLERITTLIGEGMPSTWIAEDIGCHYHTVLRHSPQGKEATAEWMRAWQNIRRNETLYRLHREFAPRRQNSTLEAA